MKKRILFLCPYPVAQAPSQRFRFEQYFDLLRSKGFDLEIRSFLNMSGWSALYQRGQYLQKFLAVVHGFIHRMWALATSIPRADFVFIHREAAPLGPPLFEFMVAHLYRKKIIYDFDDAIWLPNTSDENWFAAGMKWNSKVRAICRWSHVVSAGNEFLAGFARVHSKHVIVNPTTVDTERIHNPSLHRNHERREVVTLGWTGSHSTLPYLDEIEGVLQNLEKKLENRIRFLVIADRPPSLSLSHIQFIPWSLDQEISDLMEIDIGLMPLSDSDWSRGKCGLKALQYMALGIPTVASPVGVNTIIIENGINGFLCDSPESWLSCLEKLVLDPSLRRKIGEAGREKVNSSYSAGANSSTFLSLFE